ncbi:MAG TPA: hypothetical protein VI078_01045 [bacterium]
MIILISGLAGSGKTNTSYALMSNGSCPRIVFYETDLFTGRIPFDWTNKNDIEGIYQRAGLLVANDMARGDSSFILTLSIPMLRHFTEFRPYLRTAGPLFLFCLRCDKHEVLRRIHERNRHPQQRQLELDSIDSDYEYLNRFATPHEFVFHIDNASISEKQVAGQIAGEIAKHAEPGVVADGSRLHFGPWSVEAEAN